MGEYYQELPQMDVEELRERTNKMFPCFVDENRMCFEAEKGDVFNQTFLWDKTPINYLGEFSECGIFVDDGSAEGTRTERFKVRKYITMHKYAYLFKPSLAEVAMFLPKALFDNNEKLYIMTRGIYRDKDSPFPIGNDSIHLAETFVCFKVPEKSVN
ncbi:hypothetical protein A9K97_gp029 [Tokyovirus A1]|uniref:hypothetical protein n=1 Tax=Tokyovirus A1 TaxID=1826170 RepID=UPI0007A95EB8|nr:hypothetical protein A9K97_gp029 [Tokyovirus A1]BAU80322.1 hypothetical protein [Tokyovirus A1]